MLVVKGCGSPPQSFVENQKVLPERQIARRSLETHVDLGNQLANYMSSRKARIETGRYSSYESEMSRKSELPGAKKTTTTTKRDMEFAESQAILRD
jgi:hypothetical protein